MIEIYFYYTDITGVSYICTSCKITNNTSKYDSYIGCTLIRAGETGVKVFDRPCRFLPPKAWSGKFTVHFVKAERVALN